MSTYSVYHTKNENFHYNFPGGSEAIKKFLSTNDQTHVLVISNLEATSLNDVFRKMNDDGFCNRTLPPKNTHYSTSVGDIIYNEKSGIPFLCYEAGFLKLSKTKFLEMVADRDH